MAAMWWAKQWFEAYEHTHRIRVLTEANSGETMDIPPVQYIKVQLAMDPVTPDKWPGKWVVHRPGKWQAYSAIQSWAPSGTGTVGFVYQMMDLESTSKKPIVNTVFKVMKSGKGEISMSYCGPRPKDDSMMPMGCPPQDAEREFRIILGTQEIMCPEDFKTCPDGTKIHRVKPTCEFEKCPPPATIQPEPIIPPSPIPAAILEPIPAPSSDKRISNWRRYRA